jgi:rhomboid protease GluP
MDPAAPDLPPERVYSINYPELGPRFNRDFRGRGTLAIRSSPPAFVFSGQQRKAVGTGAETELAFAPDQIWNVQVRGEMIEFATRLGASGRAHQPFLFACRTAEEAAEVAGLLPATKDADFIAGEEFLGRLRRLPAPAHRWGWVTNLLIGANIVVFVIMGLLGAGWFEVADMMPYIRHGANRADITTDGQWWRLVASMFLHYGVVHLLLNMWALLQAGHLVERLFGRKLYTIIYFGGGVTGSLATLLWHREKLIWSAGASGAVFAVYGALLGYMARERRALPKTVFQPLLKSTGLFAVYNVLFGLAHPNIDNAAHLGGLAGGALLGWALALPMQRDVRARLEPRRLALGLALTAVIVAAGVIAAPRYDYHLTEEIAMQRVNEAWMPKELALAQRQAALLATYVARKDAAELSRFLSAELLPFYEGWRDDLRRLEIEPGRRTAQRRDGFAGILQMKIDASRHLLDALKQGGAGALEKYRAEEHAIAEAVRKLKGAGK